MSINVNINLHEKKPDEYINFSPANETEEIVQNVRTICTTPKNSCPLDRDFGVDGNFIDLPTPAAIAQIQRELIQAIKKYEPRCKVEYIEFTNKDDEQLNAQIKISIKDNDTE